MALDVHNVLDTYAHDLARGSIPAGKFHRLAGERHLRDRANQATPGFPFVFDLARAERFFRFAERLRHYKGEWAGRLIVLQPHQKFRLGSLFGWVHLDTGLRRFRHHYNELPRKQGKSLEAAIVALYLTFFDGEGGAEGYCVATKREQAKIVYRDCARLVMSSGLRTRLRVLVANLHRDDTASKLEPLGADRDSTDGLNPQVVIIDEAHAMKNRGMIDVMETAIGARRQPVIFWITTAGNNSKSPCGDQHDYACKVLEQVHVDETLFAFIAHIDEKDDWRLESTWRKANPNFGISVKPDVLRSLAEKAVNMPAAAAAFRQKHLNEWVNTSTPWLSLEGWRKGQTTDWSATPAVVLRDGLASMAGARCWLGIDLSSKIDLTAIAALFAPTDIRKSWRLLLWGLTPEETLLERAHRDQARYPEWVDGGYLQTNPGNRIDQNVVRDIVRGIAARFKVQQIGIDPWNAGNLMEDLTEDGFEVIEVAQTMKEMSAPSKEFEADVLDGLVDAGGNPLMGYCVSNAVVQTDGKDNIYPVKKRSRGRIDPVVATIIARRVATQSESKPPQFQMLFVGGGTTR